MLKMEQKFNRQLSYRTVLTHRTAGPFSDFPHLPVTTAVADEPPGLAAQALHAEPGIADGVFESRLHALKPILGASKAGVPEQNRATLVAVPQQQFKA